MDYLQLKYFLFGGVGRGKAAHDHVQGRDNIHGKQIIGVKTTQI